MIMPGQMPSAAPLFNPLFMMGGSTGGGMGMGGMGMMGMSGGMMGMMGMGGMVGTYFDCRTWEGVLRRKCEVG
jgi:hypothetical protein